MAIAMRIEGSTTIVCIVALLVVGPTVAYAATRKRARQDDGKSVPSFMRELTARLSRVSAPACDDIGWMMRELGPPAGNVTGVYLRTLKLVQSNVHSAVLTSDYVYVLVPGLLSSYSPGYFRQALERLRDLGLDARYLGVDSSTDATSEANAARLRLAFTNVHRGSGGKKLVIIAHSKGCLDSSLALTRFPELAGMVHAVVALQAPYGGAAIADDIAVANPAMRELLERALAGFGLGIASLRDMSYGVRRVLIGTHGHLCARHPSLRVISLASCGPRTLASPLAPTAAYLRQAHDADSDGLVCVEDALFPGSLAIVLDDDAALDSDHGTPVLPAMPGARLRGDDMVEAAVTIALTPDSELEGSIHPWVWESAAAADPTISDEGAA